MATLSELLAQKAEIDKAIAEAQREEKAAAIAQIRQLMAQYGLTLADLGPRALPPARRTADGAKVAPKYRDPATGATWSGRGLQPRWLKAALDQGRKIDEFAL